MDAVRLLNDGQGFGLGHRHITISTVGIVPQIDAFADIVEGNNALLLAVNDGSVPVPARRAVLDRVEAFGATLGEPIEVPYVTDLFCTRSPG